MHVIQSPQFGTHNLIQYAYDIQVPTSTTGFNYQQVSNVNFANPQPANSFNQPQQTQFGAPGPYMPMVGSAGEQTQIGGSAGFSNQPSNLALNYAYQPPQQFFTQQ